MEIKIITRPSVFLETVELVCRYVNNQTLENSRRDFFLKFAGQLGDGCEQEAVFETLEALMAEGTRDLDPREPRLCYYFRDMPLEGNQQRICLAKILLYSFYEGEGFSFAEGLAECRRRYGEFRREDFSGYRIMDIDPHGLNLVPLGCDAPAPLFQQLEAFDLPAGDKWEIYRNLRDYDSALEELKALLEPVARRIGPVLERYQPLLEQTADYWRDYFAVHSFRDFKAELLGVERETAEAAERVVWFWWMGFGQLHCYQSRDREALNIGVLVRRENSPKAAGYVQGNVQNILKLLSDKSKYDLLRRMVGRQSYGLELANEMGLTSGTISKHLNTLFSFGLLKLQRVNNRVYYQTDEGAVRLFLEQLAEGILGKQESE